MESDTYNYRNSKYSHLEGFTHGPMKIIGIQFTLKDGSTIFIENKMNKKESEEPFINHSLVETEQTDKTKHKEYSEQTLETVKVEVTEEDRIKFLENKFASENKQYVKLKAENDFQETIDNNLSGTIEIFEDGTNGKYIAGIDSYEITGDTK